MKKILIINSSFRKNGNSNHLSTEFSKGVIDAGNMVETISLSEKKIGFCTGCLVCQKTSLCILKDDMSEIIEKIRLADVIVFVTPIYFYEMTGQMKTLLDRTNPLFSSEYSFRDIYLIATSADDSKEAMEGAIKGLQGWISCFEKSRLVNIIFGTGLDKKDEIKAHKKLLLDAYMLGKSIQ